MPDNTADQVMEQVAEIIRRVGKRDDILDEVAENVDFSELTAELLKKEGPTRDAASKIVLTYLKGVDIEEDSRHGEQIMEAIDFKELIGSISGNDDFRKALIDTVKSALENAQGDTLQETVEEAFGLNDSDTLLKNLGKQQTAELQDVVAASTLAYLKKLDFDDFEDDFKQDIENAVFTQARIDEALKDSTTVNQLVLDAVKTILKNSGERDSSDPIVRLVTQNKSFIAAVDLAITDLVRAGKVNQLVEEVGKTILTKDAGMRSQITDALSEKLVEKLAEAMVGRLFGPQK